MISDADNRKPSAGGKVLAALSWILLIVLALACAYFLYQMIEISIFSVEQMVFAGVVVVLLGILLSCGMIIIRKKKIWKYICMVLALALSVCFSVGGFYIQKTSEVFTQLGASSNPTEDDDDDMSGIMSEADLLTSKMAITVSTYAMQQTGIQTPNQISESTRIGTVPGQDEKGTEGAIEQLKKSGAADFEEVEYTDVYAMTDALFNGEVDAIIFPEQYHEELLNVANDDNKYNALTTFTNVVDQYIYYEDIPEDMINPADPVKDITKDPFTVLISGSDSYGTLNSKSRSDVNMLVTVNPETYQVAIISLPRDAYMPFSCKKNETACGYAAGQKDKLTHSGIYGIGTTESSLEDFLGIEINYTVRVNFSSLINVVDAIGGIDVDVDEGLEVDTFYANGTEGVHAGINHLNGERALAFARERHAYVDGDNQRIRNQQIVMKAIMKAMMSPTMIVNYPKFLRALSTAFSTNMPSDQIRDLIRLEVSQFPDWNIQSFAMSGDSTTAFSAALNMYSSVSVVSQDQIDFARSVITDVLDGKTIDLSTLPEFAPADLSSVNDYSPSTYDPSQVADDDVQIQIPVDNNWSPSEPTYTTPDTSTGGNESDRDTSSNPWTPPADNTPVVPDQNESSTSPDTDPVQDPVPDDGGQE